MKLTPRKDPPQPPDSQTAAGPSLESPSENFSATSAEPHNTGLPYVLDVDWFPTRRKAMSTALTLDGTPHFSAQHPETVIRWIEQEGGTLTHLVVGDYLIRVGALGRRTDEEIAKWPRRQHRS